MEQKISKPPQLASALPCLKKMKGAVVEEGEMANLFNTVDARTGSGRSETGGWRKGMGRKATTYCRETGEKGNGDGRAGA